MIKTQSTGENSRKREEDQVLTGLVSLVCGVVSKMNVRTVARPSRVIMPEISDAQGRVFKKEVVFC